jgi:CDP-ribitol ribitolphosphotransferase / teichoic acid ribitol-phosphate polymerase
MGVTGPTDPASRDAPGLDLVSVGWRRIQLLVRVRSGAALDPSLLRLQHRESGTLMVPTGWERESDPATVEGPEPRRPEPRRPEPDGSSGVTVIRFNVMQGPGQAPLEPGRWDLVGDQGSDAPRPRIEIHDPSPGMVPEGRTIELRTADYVVEPLVTGDPPSLCLDIRVVAAPARAAAYARAFPHGLRYWLGKVGVWGFRVVFRVVHALSRHTGRRILFSSDRHGMLTGNLRLVHDRMMERGLDQTFELQTLFKPGIATRRTIADRVRLPWLLARADVIVIDDFQPVIRNLATGDARIIQLWHAVGAFKTIGYSRVGKPGAPDAYDTLHKNYRQAIVSSSADVPVYAEAFGIPESRVVPTGIPRVDPMFDAAHRARALAHVRGLFPATEGRFTMLFAPTFRGNGARSATYDLGRVDYPRLHALCVERDAVCLIRMHPFVREPLRIPPELADRLIDASTPDVEPNDLLFAVDLLITDYSSIVFEYSTLNRPMLFFAYDLDEYIASRDFYEPFESFVPGRIVRTFDELLDAIWREDYQLEKVEPFASRHFDHLDGSSTDRVIDLITAP